MKGRTVILWMLAVLVTGCLVSCSKEEDPQGRTYQKVLLLYSAGYNNLSGDLRENINEMCQDVPTRFLSGAYKVIVFSHLKYGGYSGPVLIDATLGSGGKVELDTLVRYPSNTVSASAQTVKEVLRYVKENYPAREYGMIISSHASGWVPAGYFNNPEDDDDENWIWENTLFLPSGTASHWESYYTAERPEVKSLCYQDVPSGLGPEVDLDDFADAIRTNGLHFKYIVFDMCLMGCVEVAYELRDIVDYVVFSPAEVLTGGFAYKTILQRLLYSPSPDVVGTCVDYFDKYARKSATVSAVDCRRMDYLVSVCSDLFAEYYGRIMALDQDKVQPYCTQRRYFFDLRDALVKAGISDGELSQLDAALRQCVLYHNETAHFRVGSESFELKNCCGLSMYLPDQKRPILNGAYKELAWNKETSLVK